MKKLNTPVVPALNKLIQVFVDMKTALMEKALPVRCLFIFWLLGPFILLIERTPGDVWVSFLAIAFVLRSCVRRDGSWLRVAWVKATFVFWGVCIFSSIMSSHVVYSLGETIAWIRFPLFAMATVFWLAVDRRLQFGMLALIGVGMFIMCAILLAEFSLFGLVGGNRLSWPYGDLVPGSYLSKASMPAFVVLVAVATSSRSWTSLLAGLLSAFTLFVSFLTGERINFIMRLCGSLLAGLSWRPDWRRLLLINMAVFITIGLAVAALPTAAKRYSADLFDAISMGQKSEHFRVIAGGLVAFEQSPLIGIGPGNYTLLSPEILKNRPDRKIDVHPHNFYVQLLAETGILGFAAGVFFIGSIVATTLRHSWKNRDHIVCATAYIAPLAVFWPIASTSDFFGQWNNIFMWSGLAMSLAATNISSERAVSA